MKCEHLGQQAKEFVFRMLWKSKFFRRRGRICFTLRLSVHANGMKGCSAFLTRAVQVVSQLTLEHLRCFRRSRFATTVSATCVDQTRPKTCGVHHVFDVIVCLTLCPSGLCSQVRVTLVGLQPPHRHAAFLTRGDFGHLTVCFQEFRWRGGDVAHVIPR